MVDFAMANANPNAVKNRLQRISESDRLPSGVFSPHPYTYCCAGGEEGGRGEEGRGKEGDREGEGIDKEKVEREDVREERTRRNNEV